LFGHSFGGTVALVLSAMAAPLVLGCIAVSPFGVGPDIELVERSSIAMEFDQNLSRHANRPDYVEARAIADNVPARMLAWASLTPTELDVVRLIAEGFSNPEIGTRLFITRATVKTHLSHVFTKLGVMSRAELAAEATRRGL
jgi:DNA-binding CsgD family transcriptional regulator